MLGYWEKFMLISSNVKTRTFFNVASTSVILAHLASSLVLLFTLYSSLLSESFLSFFIQQPFITSLVHFFSALSTYAKLWFQHKKLQTRLKMGWAKIWWDKVKQQKDTNKKIKLKWYSMKHTKNEKSLRLLGFFFFWFYNCRNSFSFFQIAYFVTMWMFLVIGSSLHKHLLPFHRPNSEFLPLVKIEVALQS